MILNPGLNSAVAQPGVGGGSVAPQVIYVDPEYGKSNSRNQNRYDHHVIESRTDPSKDKLIGAIDKQNKLLETLALNMNKGGDEKKDDEKKFLEKKLRNLEKLRLGKVRSTWDLGK